MRSLNVLKLAAVALFIGACSGTTPPAVTPRSGEPISPLFVKALTAEAEKSTAADAYLNAIDAAAADPAHPEALAVVLASLDALVWGATPELEVAGSNAIVFRSADAAKTTVTRLEAAWAKMGELLADRASDQGVIARAMLARALHFMSMESGDERAAALWMGRRACALTASAIGPFDFRSLASLEGPSPIPTQGPLPASMNGIAPFSATLTPVLSEADACSLDVKAGSYLQGARAVIVDVESPSAQRASLIFQSSSAAVVEVGGVPVVKRAFDAGGGNVVRLGSVELAEGWTRVVVRLARRSDGDRIELNMLGQDGERLKMRAPKPGDVAPGRATNPKAIEIQAQNSDASRVTTASALLALGEARVAEHLVEPIANSSAATGGAAVSTRSAELDLVYARALLLAGDVPFTKASTRLRESAEHVTKEWKGSWEGKLLGARLAERRKGWGDGAMDALTELGVVVAGPGESAVVPSAKETDPLVLATIAMIAKRSRLSDVAEAAYTELGKAAPGSTLLTHIDMALHGRAGAEQVRVACESGVDRATTLCFEALAAIGDTNKAIAELERLRRLRTAPHILREQEIHRRIIAGDRKGALALYDALPPDERGMLDVLGFVGIGDKRLPDAKDRFARDRMTARDAPWSFAPLGRLLGVSPDPAPALEQMAKALVAADKSAAFLPGAGTAILEHSENYEIDERGLVHYVLHDLRRVSGTTDVAYGAHSYGPIIEGRMTSRLLRRRIHKPDGRVLEPDAAAFAAQGGSDLSQLETGDYVEQITEGWSLPNEQGQLTLDTPDLLPERTSVKNATITLRYPSKIKAALWAHPTLGKPVTKTEGNSVVYTYRLADAKPRRIEDGVPPLERSVAISFGTQSWENIGKSLEEQIRSLQDSDPFVARWIDEAAGSDKTPSRALVERIVSAAGKKIKQAYGGELTDTSALYSDGAQRTTARAMLMMGQGSRTWLIYRALRSLGVSADIAISETEPYTTAQNFPVHAGRFRHPLVVAHLGGQDGDVWIDADVDGPPLPPGRISPELRGRTAMLPGGKFVNVEGTATDSVDEVDVRLVLDDKGDAKGTFTILLHGRPAQILSDAFEVVVGTERREILRTIVLGWLPWADVEDVALSSKEGSWEVALRASIKINGFGRPEGKDGKVWVLPGLEPVHILGGRNTVSTLGATYASRADRRDALSIDSPMQYHFRRRIELPAGAVISREPAVIDVQDPHLSATRKGVYKGNVIEEDYHLNLPTGTVDAAEYQAFVERVHVVDDGFMAGIRVKK
ncbi:MAG: hypothetical protein IPK82_11705 [Polyangiaceae bacterium]|nr:hypothetical protein [Polyangiaceae bacterium]